jgi:hypothetical protein
MNAVTMNPATRATQEVSEKPFVIPGQLPAEPLAKPAAVIGPNLKQQEGANAV